MRDNFLLVDTEELLVSDEAGHVYFYAIEWPSAVDRDIFDWPGCLTLLARITVHTQQICGLAWAPDGGAFATGGNDNLCHLFDTTRVLAEAATLSQETGAEPATSPNARASGLNRRNVTLNSPAFGLSALFARHRFVLAAA